MIPKIDFIENPDGSVSSRKNAMKEGREKVIATALFNMQKRMPAGQKWSLYSWGACRQIAAEIENKIKNYE